PLCGALDDPTPMMNQNMASILPEVLAKQAEMKDHLQQLKANHQLLTTASVRHREQNTQLVQLEPALTNLREKRNHHRAAFCWPEFSPTDNTDFLSYKNKNQLAETHIKSGEVALKDLRTQLQATQAKIEKYKSTLTEFEQRMSILDQLIHYNLQQIKTLKEVDYKGVDENILRDKKAEIENKINLLEKSHERLTASIQSLRTEFAHINGERGASKEQFQQLYQQISSKQAEISALLKEHRYNDIVEVQHILQKNMDVERLRKTIQEFNLHLQILLRQIATLEQRIVHDNYDESNYQEKTTFYKLKREEMELQI